MKFAIKVCRLASFPIQSDVVLVIVALLFHYDTLFSKSFTTSFAAKHSYIKADLCPTNQLNL